MSGSQFPCVLHFIMLIIRKVSYNLHEESIKANTSSSFCIQSTHSTFSPVPCLSLLWSDSGFVFEKKTVINKLIQSQMLPLIHVSLIGCWCKLIFLCWSEQKVLEQLGNVRAQHLVYGLDSINNTSTVFDEN